MNSCLLNFYCLRFIVRIGFISRWRQQRFLLMATDTELKSGDGFDRLANKATFIFGYPKSGTTLLLALLDNHPELVVLPEESNFFYSVLPEVNKVKAILENTAIRNFSNHHAFTLGMGQRDYSDFDFKSFVANLKEQIALSRGDKEFFLALIKSFYLAKGSAAGAKRWVEKTPHNEYYFHLIREWFDDDAICFHVMRDPRDVFGTYRELRARKGKKLSLSEFCLRWALSSELALRLASQYGNYYIILYSNLVYHPQETMEKVAALLGIKFHESLLRPTLNGVPWVGNSTNDFNFIGVSPAAKGRYKERLTAREVRKIESKLGGYMRLFGYHLETSPGLSLGNLFFRMRVAKLIHWNYGHIWRLGKLRSRIWPRVREMRIFKRLSGLVIISGLGDYVEELLLALYMWNITRK